MTFSNITSNTTQTNVTGADTTSPSDTTRQDRALIVPLNTALNKSILFYSNAAQTAHSGQNRNLFARIAKSRRGIVAGLQPLADTPPQKGYTFGSALQKMYPDMILALQPQADPNLVRQAYQLEEEILHRLQNAMESLQCPTLKAVLIDIFPQANGEQVLYPLEYAC